MSFRHKFRKQYVALGIIRTFFPGTPILTLLATCPPHVRKRVHWTLGMANPTCLIQRSVDRPNIFLSVQFMSSMNAYSELDYLIPLNVESASDIPKTIVFVDNRKIVWDLTSYLLDRIDSTFRSEDEFVGIVRDYSTIMSQEHRNNVLEDFADGSVRILVCTEAAGMGVDIPDVCRVVQWGVPTFINLSTIWQRMGRAGRATNIQAVFTLFAQRSIRVMPVDPLEIYRTPIKDNDPKSKAIMKQIVAFEEQVDELAETFGANAITNFDEEVCLELPTEQQTEQQDEAWMMYNIPARKGQKKDTRLSYDRGVLSLAATTGCLRTLFLWYFETEAKTLPSVNHCCTGCAQKSEIDQSIRRLLPPSFFDDPTDIENDSDSEDSGDEDEDDLDAPDADDTMTAGNSTTVVMADRPCRTKPTPKWLAVAALKAIYAFRDKIWLEDIPVGIPKKLSGLGPQCYLSYTEIQSLSKGILAIQNPQDICIHLKTKAHYHLAPIAPHVGSLVEECKRIVRDTPAPPQRRRTRVQGPTSSTSNSTTLQSGLVQPCRSRQASIRPLQLPAPPTKVLDPPTSLVNPPNSQHAQDPSTLLMPPPPLPTPKKAYDPIKRHQYYIRARDKKRAALSELHNVVPTPPLQNPKRLADQENLPPCKKKRL